jgi:EAL domain-containing protein (putative c-di-GMP-specific phosphodiesterase class I)/CHASE2 domain-containing sensor protein/GGDEF domain-containing protein
MRMATEVQAWRGRYAAWSVLILAIVSIALLAGFLRPVDDILSGLRFGLVQRPASQTLAVVEIDAKSISEAGAWPWGRARYAQAIDQLVGAGAQVVAFDVDFSTPSEGAGDAALAASITRHPGQVVLAGFVQHDRFGANSQAVVENRPIAALAHDALLASVNVPVDPDGKVRTYDPDPSTSPFPAMAVPLSGKVDARGVFEIDFGINHRDIPRLSFEDVRRGRFDPNDVRGRVILVGATAVELGDEFATPVGLVPGVFIHALAYESIVGGRALLALHPIALLLLCGMLGLLLLPSRIGGSPVTKLVIRHAVACGVILGGPFVIQAVAPVSLHLAPLMMTQVLFGVWGIRAELTRRARAIVAEREAGLLHLAMHHSETGLPNRRALMNAIDDAWRHSPASALSVVVIGVERHAEVRGIVGYDVANKLMIQLAQRLQDVAVVPLVANVSTSVLGLSVADLDPRELTDFLGRLEGLQTNFQIDGHSIDAFLRLGAARAGTGPMAPEILIERATAALTEAQRSHGRSIVYDETDFEAPSNNLALMTEMHDAIMCGDVTLHYQPKLTLADGAIASAEALCRWRHPVRGFISPDLFIPIAEETGQIRALTEWAIGCAIRDQLRLKSLGQEIMIAVNVSGRLLTDEPFRKKVLEQVAGSEARLCFEITETAVIEQPEVAIAAIAAYRAAGIKISIDDYGSGLSALGYLKMLKADELKIDRSLVTDALDSQRDRLILKSTVDLAHSLGMSVVAEGVETEAMAACLALLGCDVIQGYWLAKPLPLAGLTEFLEARPQSAAVVPPAVAA